MMTVMTMPDLKVKVHRYYTDDNGWESWHGWFFSKVYAIDKRNSRFLVYDDGDEDILGGFMWVDFTETIPDCGNHRHERILKVELVDDEEDDIR